MTIITEFSNYLDSIKDPEQAALFVSQNNALYDKLFKIKQSAYFQEIGSLPLLNNVKACEISFHDNEPRSIRYAVTFKFWVGESRRLNPKEPDWKTQTILWNHKQAKHEIKRIQRTSDQLTKETASLILHLSNQDNYVGLVYDKTKGTKIVDKHVVECFYKPGIDNDILQIGMYSGNHQIIAEDFCNMLPNNTNFAVKSKVIYQARLTDDPGLERWATGPLLGEENE